MWIPFRAMRANFLTAAALVALAAGPAFATPEARADDIAIVGARIYASPTAQPQDGMTVLVHDGRIVAIGADARLTPPGGATIIDAHGKILLAGFWNSHVHIFTHPLLHARDRTAAELNDALDGMLNRWGFTSVFDIGSLLDNTNVLRRLINSGEVRGPQILTVGEPFYPPSGVPVYVRAFLKSEHLSLPEVIGIKDAVTRERAQIAGGANGVKLFTGDIVGGSIGIETMDPALALALVREAHRRHLPVFAHPTNREGIEVALSSGVDILAHTADQSGRWDAALVLRMVKQHMALIPTLTLFEWQSDHDGASAEAKMAVEDLVQGQLRAFRAAGGEVLFGTDIGYTEAADTSDEFRLMNAAGMDWRAILASLTTTPSRRFGDAEHKGKVVVGYDADLVILRDDPAKDVHALAAVNWTISAGRVIYSAAPSK